eukprot:s614_g17.t1
MGTACCSQAEPGQKEIQPQIGQLGINPPVEAQKAKASRSPAAPAALAPVVASDWDGYSYKVFPDGSRYEGQWKDGLKHGKGRFIYPDGDVYDGEWQDGKAHGHGTYTSKQSKYVGDWQSDLKHGQAWDDTSKYTGTYSHGQKHGKGRFEWPDGSVYDGEFRNNNVEGEGTFTWKDGRQYKGQWVDNRVQIFGCLAMQLFQVPRQVFISQILEHLLSIEDVQQVSQVSWKTLEAAQCYAAVMNFAWPRLQLGLGKGKTSLRQWMPVYEACKAMVATQNSVRPSSRDLRRLNRLISFKHTRFSSDPDTYFPMPWQFKAGSVEPLLRFLWQECTTETYTGYGNTGKHIRAATYVEVLGGLPTSTLQAREPLAVIAMDAVYCEPCCIDEFLNVAALVLLDDLKIALILTWGWLKHQDGFFSIILVGAQLADVMTHASQIFESPSWTWDEADELTEWFGFDMTIEGAFEERKDLLPGLFLICWC